ncbi:MAG: hypothetical protein ABJO01_07025 [Parasphingorhabdus sp.]|uniref:hypothetical protein n=1 Tax=Parasphingorhabdus sp. TaxID=2709688 RepID=UPI0032980146
MKYIIAALLIAGSSLSPAAAVTDERAQANLASQSYQQAPDALRTWVNGRAGTGKPVHWVSDGGVYAYPSGEKLFGLIGMDSSTVIWPKNPGEEIVHLTRKTFAYTDKDSGEVITEYKGNKVKPIAYPYQLIRYRLENDLIYGDVEQGVGERKQFIKAKNGIPFRKLGNSYLYNASVWLDFPLPSGQQYQAWENYDFFFHPEGSVSEPHQMTWQRYGKLPAWAGGQIVVTHLQSWRVERQADIPAQILNWVKKDKPQWLTPPKDMGEVKSLQEGKTGPGWSG